MSEEKWEADVVIEDDGSLSVELYKNKGNVVTLNLTQSNNGHSTINWAALVDGVSHHGCVVSGVLSVERG